jgi:hypothetical protein
MALTPPPGNANLPIGFLEAERAGCPAIGVRLAIGLCFTQQLANREIGVPGGEL